MIIGIDIDNTLTEVQDKLNEAAFKYAKELGKEIKDLDDTIEDGKNNGDIFIKKFKFTYEELKYFLKDIQEEITNNAKPRSGAVETIKRLRRDGYKIYIVTARDSEFHDDPYELSKKWLDENNIEYDKLIVNAREKAPVCKAENIDLFIDDQLFNCMQIAKEGIKTIRISNEEKELDNVVNVRNWKEIYKYIKELK